ncbi:MAG: L-threonylcarbamoyladenylate synthase [Chloroflexota bacterium]|nr:L-threonylcarbamoyladenylate synthase [Chloroflexota bacterium]
MAFPTDTVYGLGARGFSPQAVERVYEAKARPRSLPLPLLLALASDLERVARKPIPELALRLAERFWPGGLTLVLRRAPAVPDAVTAGGDTVAVRVPRHPVPVALISGVGEPLTGTSANLSGRPSPLTAEEVRQQMGDRVDLILDGGRCPGGVESTVLDLTGETPVLIREGAIGREELEETAGLAITWRGMARSPS